MDLEQILQESTQKLLRIWRQVNKEDDVILRNKLGECGWKYSRSKGYWFHPAAPDYRAPKTLQELAELMAKSVLAEALNDRPD